MTPHQCPQINTPTRGHRLRILSLGAALLSVATQAHAVLIHDYQLNGNLIDALGGPALTSEGGTIGATSYAFGPNQGLTLNSTGLSNLGQYSIEMRVKLDSLVSAHGSPWIKLIDFKNLTSDVGLYSFDGGLDNTGSIIEFWPVGGTTDTFAPGEYANVVITRDSTTKEVITYAEGFGQFSFTDSGDQAVFSNDLMRFLQDDTVTGLRESGPGNIDFIKIYDSVLSAEQVEANSNVPDGGSTALMLGASLLGFGAVRRKLKSH